MGVIEGGNILIFNVSNMLVIRCCYCCFLRCATVMVLSPCPNKSSLSLFLFTFSQLPSPFPTRRSSKPEKQTLISHSRKSHNFPHKPSPDLTLHPSSPSDLSISNPNDNQHPYNRLRRDRKCELPLHTSRLHWPSLEPN